MRIEDFVQAVKECPDDKLEDELGFADNFEILVRANIDEVVADLLSRNYLRRSVYETPRKGIRSKRGYIKLKSEIIHYLFDPSGKVILQISPRGGIGTYHIIPGKELPPEQMFHLRRQRNLFKMAIDLHPALDSPLPHDPVYLRYYANTALDIANYLTEKNLPFCISTIAWKYHNDPKRIVYFIPKKILSQV